MFQGFYFIPYQPFGWITPNKSNHQNLKLCVGPVSVIRVNNTPGDLAGEARPQDSAKIGSREATATRYRKWRRGWDDMTWACRYPRAW